MNFWEFVLDHKVELANQTVEHIGLTSASLAIAVLLGVIENYTNLDKDQVFNYVREQTQQKYDINWLTPFGFNNSYALMMRNDDIERLGINSISELKDYLSTVP